MNHTQLIKRAIGITWRYKVLWIFGILLALTGGGGGGGGGGGSSGFNADRGTTFPGFRPEALGLDRIDWSLVAGIVALCCCALLIWMVIATILQYVARAALFRIVDHSEETGVMPTWREGFRLGWSNRTFRLWLLDLIVGIPFAIAAILLLLLGATPLLFLAVDSPAAKVLGIAMTIGFELLVILALVVAGVVLSVLRQFWWREIALGDRSVGQAFYSGYALVRSRGKDIALMWLLMFGIRLAYGLIAVVSMIVIFALAAGVGAGIGFLVHSLTQSVVWAVVLGLPLFFVILIVPLIFVEGLWLVFESTAWTLTYRETTGNAAVG